MNERTASFEFKGKECRKSSQTFVDVDYDKFDDEKNSSPERFLK